MKILILILLLLIPSVSYAEDYWVYIKQVDEITDSKSIAGTSQKGDIVDIIPCSRLGKNEPSKLEQSKWLIIKVSDLTAFKLENYLKPYTVTETKTIDGVERQFETIKAYRKYKLDVDSLKITQSIDSKTSFVTTAISNTAISATEKTETDISNMMKLAKDYDRLMPVRLCAKQAWEWIIPNAYCATNRTVTVITTGGGDYASLVLAEDGEDGDLTDNGGDTLTINCSGTIADTISGQYALNFYGNTTNSTCFWTINGNWDGGNWDTSKYRLVVTATDNSQELIYGNYNKIIWNNIQIESNGSSYSGVNALGHAVNHQFYSCYLKASNIVTLVSGGDNIFINTILSGANAGSGYDGALWADSGCTLYNCTIYNCRYGIINWIGTWYITNCAVFGNTYDFYATSGVSYCASDDNTGTNAINISPGATESDDWNNAFTDYTNGDFHIKDTDSVLYNAGTDLSGTFTTDIEGNTRSNWDIGADEYVSTSTPTRNRIIMISKHDNTKTNTNNSSNITYYSFAIPAKKRYSFC